MSLIAEFWVLEVLIGAGAVYYSTRKEMPFCSQYVFAQLSGPQMITRSFEQKSKACSPMDCTLSGITSSFSDEQNEKAYAPIFVTAAGI